MPDPRFRERNRWASMPLASELNMYKQRLLISAPTSSRYVVCMITTYAGARQYIPRSFYLPSGLTRLRTKSGDRRPNRFMQSSTQQRRVRFLVRLTIQGFLAQAYYDHRLEHTTKRIMNINLDIARRVTGRNLVCMPRVHGRRTTCTILVGGEKHSRTAAVFHSRECSSDEGSVGIPAQVYLTQVPSKCTGETNLESSTHQRDISNTLHL